MGRRIITTENLEEDQKIENISDRRHWMTMWGRKKRKRC